MNHILITWKAAIVACCTALTAFLGWRGILATEWTPAPEDVDAQITTISDKAVRQIPTIP